MMMTQMWLLPDWLRAVWIVALCGVAVLHLRHAWVMTGQRRYWHIGHILMGVGMAYMYLPHSAHLIPSVAGTAVFATAAIASTIAAVWFRLRYGALQPLWILSVVEMAVMIYMFLPMSTRSALLSYALAAYLFGQGVLWALGVWDRYLVDRRLAGAFADKPRIQSLNVSNVAPSLAGQSSPALRVSLVTMTAGMAYMLLAM